MSKWRIDVRFKFLFYIQYDIESIMIFGNILFKIQKHKIRIYQTNRMKFEKNNIFRNFIYSHTFDRIILFHFYDPLSNSRCHMKLKSDTFVYSRKLREIFHMVIFDIHSQYHNSETIRYLKSFSKCIWVFLELGSKIISNHICQRKILVLIFFLDYYSDICN